jgi:hypothetical protein
MSAPVSAKMAAEASSPTPGIVCNKVNAFVNPSDLIQRRYSRIEAEGLSFGLFMRKSRQHATHQKTLADINTCTSLGNLSHFYSPFCCRRAGE